MTLVRDLIQRKSQTIVWTKGHSGNPGNECVDQLAKQATKLPPQPPQTPVSCWEFAYSGEVFHPPNKVWTHDLIPSHSHSDIHPISFAPLRTTSLIWLKWIFGHMWRPGFSHFATFWSLPPKPSKTPCPICHLNHNRSMHGCIAFCTEDHPLVKAWCLAWGSCSTAVLWRRQASANERRLLGKLCIPQSLFTHLVRKVGRKDARKAIGHFHRSATTLLDAAAGATPPTSPTPAAKRPSPWRQEDYDHGLLTIPLPSVRKRSKR